MSRRSSAVAVGALGRLKSWEGFLLVLLLVIIMVNSINSPAYLSIGNQVNLFILSIEKIIVVLAMTFIIINAEIDLSVASMMGLSACTLGWLHEQGVPIGLAFVAGLLVGALATGFLLALLMANSGGAWDNAKKYIEAGNYGGKGSDAHKAAVIGDTIGDPFKDTAGPSLNILIKLLGVVSLIALPLFL